MDIRTPERWWCDSIDGQPVEAFEHAPLEPDHIRLLEIEAAGFDLRDIRIAIRHYPRHAAPAYQAISYTWGQRPHTMEKITLNGKSLPVTQNAFWCLMYVIQHYPRWKYLWRDSVCINQKDLTERNHQVKAMALIYRRATLVVAWLGSDREITSGQWIGGSYRRTDDRWRWGWHDSPYWQRIWIIQELYCARDIVFLYGHQHCEWQRMGLEDSIEPVDLSSMREVLDLVRHQQDQIAPGEIQRRKTVSLREAGHRFSDRRCSDDRDRLYAVLGLLPRHEAKALSRYFPDYTLSYNKYAMIIVCHCLLWYQDDRKELNDSLRPYGLCVTQQMELKPSSIPREHRLAVTRDLLPASLTPLVNPLWQHIIRSKLASSTARLPSMSPMTPDWLSALPKHQHAHNEGQQETLKTNDERNRSQEQFMHDTIARCTL